MARTLKPKTATPATPATDAPNLFDAMLADLDGLLAAKGAKLDADASDASATAALALSMLTLSRTATTDSAVAAELKTRYADHPMVKFVPTSQSVVTQYVLTGSILELGGKLGETANAEGKARPVTAADVKAAVSYCYNHNLTKEMKAAVAAGKSGEAGAVFKALVKLRPASKSKTATTTPAKTGDATADALTAATALIAGIGDEWTDAADTAYEALVAAVNALTERLNG